MRLRFVPDEAACFVGRWAVANAIGTDGRVVNRIVGAGEFVEFISSQNRARTAAQFALVSQNAAIAICIGIELQKLPGGFEGCRVLKYLRIVG